MAISWVASLLRLTVVARKGATPSAYRAQKPRHGRPMAGVCCVCDLADGRAWIVASKADEDRRSACPLFRETWEVLSPSATSVTPAARRPEWTHHIDIMGDVVDF